MSRTMPGPTALPAIDVPAPRMVSGMPVVPGDVDASRRARRRAAGRTTTCGDDPVERGVGGVERPGQRRVVDVGHAARRSAASSAPPGGGASPQLERAAQDPGEVLGGGLERGGGEQAAAA